MNFYNRVSETQHTPSVAKDYADSFTGATSTASTTKKQTKLSEIDKIKIAQMFKNLELDKCWRLSSKTIAEERIKEFVVGCNYEQ